jgi:hypothetical protein
MQLTAALIHGAHSGKRYRLFAVEPKASFGNYISQGRDLFPALFHRFVLLPAPTFTS